MSNINQDEAPPGMVEVAPTSGCKGCYYQGDCAPVDMLCTPRKRTDGKNVIFTPREKQMTNQKPAEV